MENNWSDLSDLLGAEIGTSQPLYQRAAEGPSAVPATIAPPKAVKRATDKQTMAEGIPATMREADIAALFGIATSHVRTKARDGIMVKAGHARFDVRQSLVRYLDQLRSVAARSGPGTGAATDEMKAEKLRLAKEQADKLEIANAAARGELVKAAEVEREWANVLRDVRSTLLAVPSRVGAKLPHLTAHDVAEIDRELKAALEGLAHGH